MLRAISDWLFWYEQSLKIASHSNCSGLVFFDGEKSSAFRLSFITLRNGGHEPISYFTDRSYSGR